MADSISHRILIAASILDADLANLGLAVEQAEAAGADRIHLDVMDGHFVPNLTFGAKTVKALRRHTDLPFDAHLMISNPHQYVGEFLDAGCDSITCHVEVEVTQIEPTLRSIRDAGRLAGLSVKPGTPLAALDPYRSLLDIVMVMTVEPGFGGQAFMRDVAAEKLRPARGWLADPASGEVHVDGGVKPDTAGLAGAQGTDVLVVGSALFHGGVDMATEIRRIRDLATDGERHAAEASGIGTPSAAGSGVAARRRS